MERRRRSREKVVESVGQRCRVKDGFDDALLDRSGRRAGRRGSGKVRVSDGGDDEGSREVGQDGLDLVDGSQNSGIGTFTRLGLVDGL